MPPDGRLAKGAVRRRALIAATLRLVGRSGVAAVSQRAVAAEAGVPPSAVLYYYASVDGLLVSALREVNERYCAELAEITSIDDLAAHVARYAALDRELVIAEYELWLLAARREDLREELTTWDETVDALAARLAPARADLLAAALNGLYLRAATTGVTAQQALRTLTATTE
ncbi:TetR/AcrR family transcriptional regulator [Pseudonocardia pini]|uniref:TetR/AcrR family transcriptional regulator n=1 Tax=Pseudonocardia pini TaxID=2758030 RepID=UPI0015F0FA2F|nr:TetR family transcriptional regulator [Pseudonocardia pini]